MSFSLREDPTPRWEKWVPGEFDLSGIHIWKGRLVDWAKEEKKLFSWLSETEKGRAQRLRGQNLRQRFTISHGLVREILGCYLHQPAEKVELDALPSGKPFLAGNLPLQFNYSHSEDLLIMAVSEGYELGVDLEQIKPEIEHSTISRHFFSPDEMGWLQTLEPEDQVKAFYYLWTCKEAVLKADGSGLRQSLDAVRIEFGTGKKKWHGRLAAGKITQPEWTIQTFRPEPEYVAALAYQMDARGTIQPELRFLQLTE